MEDLTLKDVNIQTCWDKGRTYTESFIQDSECDHQLKEIDLIKLCMMGNTTILKVKKFGVTTISTNDDEKVCEMGSNTKKPEDVDDEAQSIDDSGASIIDFLEESTNGQKFACEVEVEEY